MSGGGRTLKKPSKGTKGLASKGTKGLAFLLKTAKTKRARQEELVEDLKKIVKSISEFVEVDPIEYLKKVTRLLNATITKYTQETDAVGSERNDELITELEVFISNLAENIHPAITKSVSSIKPTAMIITTAVEPTDEEMNDDLGDLMSSMIKMRVTK